MVNVLDIKVLRDLWSMRTQVASIALLIAAAVAVLVMSVSNYLALVGAMNAHYHNERFADVFASMKRAPLGVAERLREIEGVGVVAPRVSQVVRVIRSDTDLSISGRLLAIPATGQPLLNRLHLTSGRWIDPNRPEEIIINQAYARARHVRPDDFIKVVVNERLQTFRVVGIALSPEFVFATRPGVPLPDNRNFVVIWASKEAVESAFDMRGAFNDVILTLAPGGSVRHIIAELDRILKPYGGIGAYDRDDLNSHRVVQDELTEQETVSIVMPMVFFGIAAFLLFVVLGRLIETQREQIAALKALGYSNTPIVVHYFKLVSVIALLGSVIGLALGRWGAVNVIENYRRFFRFPSLEPHLEIWTILVAVAAAVLVANAAAARAVYRVAALPPAEAMRPQVPEISTTAAFIGAFWNERFPVQYLITLRAILGRPIRTILTIAGIALAFPLVLFGLFWFDALDYMIDVSFSRIERGDSLVVFAAPVPTRALHELRSIPGVILVEGQRLVPVRLVAGHRKYLLSLSGLSKGSELKILRDRALKPVAVPSDGLMLSRPLAKRLRLSIGDNVTVEVLDGKQPVLVLPVVKLSDDILGYTAAMEVAAQNRALKEGEVFNAAALKVDPKSANSVWRELQQVPKIEASSVKGLWLTLFNETFAGMIIIGALILSGFGLLIAVGVVYNSARVAYHERAWELASLRIVGMTKAEVATILLSELAIELIVAIPLGLLTSYGLINVIISLRVSESFQVPVIIEPASYAYAALAVCAAAAFSAYVIWRRIEGLDIISVLKTRD
ncbi:MAG: ABC transporter permease [Hyphomicrobiaceae bacterium]